ncbi:MAG TPA: YfcE family phosphodiesterase [Candidatus Avacidaminococcus intestinavium]|uniref:Phosphoesterase n=1 Tax=Candidatus Avacidaminococcus intestinavium TaxID=2840684 RepID=A0A9D1SLH2_9FIRM|nr:YfcE family phosphodiesterase [Candidatus Avacidaminococcus intestinavium]
MIIGITGDTHGSKKALRQVLSTAPPVDCWLHTGDYSQDAEFLAYESKLPVYKVAGNTDPVQGRANLDEVLLLDNTKIWLTHGHHYMRDYRIEELAWWGRKLEVDIVVFGHTHIPLIKWFGDILLLNPGSPVQPRDEQGPSFMVASIHQDKKPEIKIIPIISK